MGSMDGGRTLLVTTRHGQTHRSWFLGVDTETGETRLLREEYKRYGNIFNPPFLSPDGRTIAFTAERRQSPEEVWLADGELDHAMKLSDLHPPLGKFPFGHSRVLDFVGADGDALESAPVPTSHCSTGERSPLVLLVSVWRP